jgi:predicted phosphodiesterase
MNIRFAIASDLHIALPETIEPSANRFHLTQFSVSTLEVALQHLQSLELDFLLLPGDLTQDGETVNHQWLQNRLATLPYPVYVIPGNHDIPCLYSSDKVVGYDQFSCYYQNFGYHNPHYLDYTCEIAPNLQLIALNSNNFDRHGNQGGFLTPQQFIWLEETLANLRDKIIFIMIHHNVIEHLPNQSNHILGKRYMLDNASILLDLLERYQVKFIFTGHLHIQDIAQHRDIYEITTGSLITYPHPYRILELTSDSLRVESHHIQTLPEMANFAEFSQQYMSDRSFAYMMTLLTSPPLNLHIHEAQKYAPQLKNLWANIAHGDQLFDFPHLPQHVNNYFQQFGAIDSQGNPRLIDNNTCIKF